MSATKQTTLRSKSHFNNSQISVIKSNAASNELSSPFFIKNEKTCQEWETFARQNGGTINGTYNAWSYKLFIQIKKAHEWKIIVSRASYSGGNLLISTKKQNIHKQLHLKCKIDTDDAFTIKRNSFFYLFSTRKRQRLNKQNSYSVFGQIDSPLVAAISHCFSTEFEKNTVLEAALKEGILSIRINDPTNALQLVKELVDLNLC